MYHFQRNRLRLICGGNYPQCNTVFIDDEIRGFIDPGADGKRLQFISEENPIQFIINSHSHLEHMLYNILFPEASLYAHKLDTPAIEDLDCYVRQFIFPTENQERLIAIFAKNVTEQGEYYPRKVDRFLEDEEVIFFGETALRVLHCPGHTPGHLCFHFPEERVLFLADLDLSYGGPYYADEKGDIDETICSLKRLANIDVDVYISGHHNNAVFDGDPDLILRFLEKIYERDEKILETLRPGPKDLDEISSLGIIIGNLNNITSDGLWQFRWSEKAMIEKHLVRLERHGKIKKEQGLYHLL